MAARWDCSAIRRADEEELVGNDRLAAAFERAAACSCQLDGPVEEEDVLSVIALGWSTALLLLCFAAAADAAT